APTATPKPTATPTPTPKPTPKPTPSVTAPPGASVSYYAVSKFVDILNYWWTEKADEFKKKTGYEVKVDFPADLWNQIYTYVESGTQPDIFMAYTSPHFGWLAENDERRQVIDVSDVIDELGGKDNLIPFFQKAATVKGVFYGVPIWLEPNILHYNKAYFEEAGWSEPPKTWDEMYEAMVEIKKRHPDTFPFGFNIGADFYNHTTLLWDFGGGVMKGRSVKDIILKSDATRKMLEYLKKCWDAGLIPPDSPNWGGSGNNEAYISKKSFVLINAPSPYYQLKVNNDPLADDTLLIPPPVGPGNLNIYDSTAPSAVIFKSCKYPDVAKKYLIEALGDVDYMVKAAMDSYGFALPPYKNVWEELIKKGPFWEDMYEAAKLARFNYPLGEPSEAYDEAYTKEWILKTPITRVLVDGWSIDDAIDEAYNEIKKIFEKYYGA
ncbi:extracellular solute-binding protein, partial [Candidatus Bathyarchaeota archaeon]|nr:extracellular solute-binding protein [Candidatus Bathyarchaeota archaeon]